MKTATIKGFTSVVVVSSNHYALETLFNSIIKQLPDEVRTSICALLHDIEETAYQKGEAAGERIGFNEGYQAALERGV